MRTRGILLATLLVVVMVGGLLACAKPSPPAPPAPATPPAAAPKPAAPAPVAPTTAAAKPAAPAPAPAPKIVEWKFAGMAGIGSRQANNAVDLAKAIEAESKGAFKLTWYPAASLIPAYELAVAAQKGQVQIVQVPGSYATDIVKAYDYASIPFLARSVDDGMKVLDAGVRDIIKQELDKVGLVQIRQNTYGAAHIFSKVPIKTLADLKGMKIRTYGTSLNEATKAIGMVPVSVAGPELYTALQRGVVDAAWSSYMFSSDSKLQELTKYVIEVGVAASVEGILANKNAVDALPANLRDILMKAGQESQKQFLVSANAGDKEATDVFVKAGAQIIKLSDADMKVWMDMVIPKWDEWIKTSGPRGPEMLKIAKSTMGIK